MNSSAEAAATFSPVPQRSHIDDKAILHIAFEQSLISFVDLLDGDHLDIAGDPVLPAVVEHFLRLGNTADKGTGELPTLEDEIKGGYGERLFGRPDEGQGSVTLQQIEVGVDVVLRLDGIEDEVEAIRMALHFVGVF